LLKKNCYQHTKWGSDTQISVQNWIVSRPHTSTPANQGVFVNFHWVNNDCSLTSRDIYILFTVVYRNSLFQP